MPRAPQSGGTVAFGTPTSHQQRTVLIPASLVESLARRCGGKGADDLVLTSPEGAVLRSGNFRRRSFDPAATSVGLPDLTPHDLRHTAASLLVACGAHVKAVQRMLGHASAAMSLDWGHLPLAGDYSGACSTTTSTASPPAWTQPSRAP